jgi:hypothetical protein
MANNRSQYSVATQMNMAWKLVAEAPSGFASFKNSVIGSYVEDLMKKTDPEEAFEKFEAKLDPSVYQRPQVAPTEGNMKRAEEIFEKLNLASSLKRRFATYTDIPETAWVWKAPKSNALNPEPTAGLFSDIKTKEKIAAEEKLNETLSTVVEGGNITFVKLLKLLSSGSVKKVEF